MKVEFEKDGQAQVLEIPEEAQEILSKIEEDVQEHVGSAGQSDDFTCAVVKVN